MTAYEENEYVHEFKGIWIPSYVWLDSRLSALHKIILMEADCHTGKKISYMGSYEELSEFARVSVDEAKTAVKQLEEYGYLSVAEFADDEHSLILRSKIDYISGIYAIKEVDDNGSGQEAGE